MASWTDGAAYAPTERPDGFATPEVEPLTHTGNSAPVTPGPLPPPRGFTQDTPVVALDGVLTQSPSGRNPSQPFTVGGGIMTTASSMGPRALRDPRTPFHTQRGPGADTGVTTLPPPTGEPLALGPVAPPDPPRDGLDALMSSGMTRRTQPRGPSSQELATQKMLVFLAVACCLLGFTIGVVAPYMLIAAGALALRAAFLTGRAGLWAIGTGLALIMAGFIVTPDLEVLLGRLFSLSFGIGFLSLARRQSGGRS